MKDHLRKINDYLTSTGATEVKHVGSGKHIRFTWKLNGCRFVFFASSTPSDHRSTLNAISQMRRLIGLSKTTKTVRRDGMKYKV